MRVYTHDMIHKLIEPEVDWRTWVSVSGKPILNVD